MESPFGMSPQVERRASVNFLWFRGCDSVQLTRAAVPVAPSALTWGLMMLLGNCPLLGLDARYPGEMNETPWSSLQLLNSQRIS